MLYLNNQFNVIGTKQIFLKYSPVDFRLTAISFILTDVQLKLNVLLRNKCSYTFLSCTHITQNIVHIKMNINKHSTHITLVFDLTFCLGGVGFMFPLYHGQLCTNGNSLL